MVRDGPKRAADGKGVERPGQKVFARHAQLREERFRGLDQAVAGELADVVGVVAREHADERQGSLARERGRGIRKGISTCRSQVVGSRSIVGLAVSKSLMSKCGSEMLA